jgi:hypothetical protein
VHSMEKVCVYPCHCLLEQGEMGSPVDSQTVQQKRIEVDRSNKVTIAKTRVELESEEDKECGEGELHLTTMMIPDIGNRIAKADKLFKEKVIAASLGYIV